MTATATSMSLLVKVQTPRPTVDIHALPPRGTPADAEARRLAAAIARGDESAFREFYEGYHRRVFRLALVLGYGDESMAQDAVQAAFIIAAQKLPERRKRRTFMELARPRDPPTDGPKLEAAPARYCPDRRGGIAGGHSGRPIGFLFGRMFRMPPCWPWLRTSARSSNGFTSIA